MEYFFIFLATIRYLCIFFMLYMLYKIHFIYKKNKKDAWLLAVIIIFLNFQIPSEKIYNILQLGEPFLNFPFLRAIGFNFAFFIFWIMYLDLYQKNIKS